MSAITPEQAAFALQLELTSQKTEHGTTKRVIEALPADKSDYRPDPLSKTALELAWHITAAEHRFLAGISAGEFDFTPIHRPENVTTPADIASWLDRSFTENIQKISQMTPEQAAKIIDFRGIIQLPAFAYSRFSLSHTIHHRGQLSAYIRAMGGKVPAIYGESYDSAEAKKAAQAH
jgi:uncharacterized damage-inducible protein DinB